MNRRTIILIIIVILVIALGAAFLMNPSKQETKLEVVTNETLHMGSTFLVKFTDSNNNPIANENLYIKILDSNSNVVVNKEVTTNDQGIASLELDDISAGSYVVNVTFNGNDKYQNSSIKHNLVVESSSTEPVEINTNSTAATNTSSSTSSSSSSSGSSKSGSSSSDPGAFYSAQSQKTYYTGEVDLGIDGHHWQHMGNNQWVQID